MSMKSTVIVALIPSALILIVIIVGVIFGPRRYAKRNAVPTVTAIDPDRVDIARGIAASMLPPHQHPDDRTLSQMLAFCDNRKKIRAAQHLQAQTGADLAVARRIVNLLA
ncbi:hypothetical protein OG474_26970 [Kribbella sp. NBC_01505]|uniref:hypothetical protein n=1 Tax=Kribbella sp. NBC_01505 TaxID=2903580 RepID=UPI003864A4D5